jgi:phosphoglycerate dehydrogenase-like enzyme
MPTVLILDAHAGWYAERLRDAAPGFDCRPASSVEAALAAATGAEILVGLAPALPPRLLAAMDRLAWVQALTTGVDNLLPGLPPGVALTNCRGIHGPQMSELAVLLMLACARRLPAMLDDQRAGRWERREQPLLAGRTVCLVGLGSIAETLARLCGAFGMRVTGVSDGRTEAPGIARVHPRAALAEAAAEADFLVVLLPYSPETHHAVDAGVLAAMKPSAILVNISRGGCVDEEALLAALSVGRLAGAGLDVFATEPLPTDSPFRHLPNVIVTPHIGGFSDNYREQALPIVAANLAAYARGGIAALPGRLDAGARP